MRQPILTLFTLLFGAVFTAIPSIAQERSVAQIDSLKSELAKSKHDTTRLRLLCEIANGYSPAGQVNEARKYVAQAGIINKRLNHKQYRLKWLFASVFTDYYGGDMEKGKIGFEHVIALADTLHDEYQKYNTMYFLASCETGLEQYDQALNHLKTVLNYFKKAGNKKMVAVTLSLTGNVYIRMNKLADATKVLQEGLIYAKASGDVPATFNIQSNITSIFLQNGQYDKALAFCNESEKLYKGYETWPQYSSFLTHKAEALSGVGDYNKATEYYLLVAKVSLNKSNQYELMQAYSHLGQIYQMTKEYPKAAAYYKRALASAQKLGQLGKDYFSGLKSKLAQSLYELKEFDQAVMYQKQAVADAISSKSKLSHLNSLAWTYYEIKNYAEALNWGLKGAAFGKENKLPIFTINGTLGSILRDAPDKVLQNAGIKLSDRNSLMLEYLKEDLKQNLKYGELYADGQYFQLSLAYEKLHDFEKAFKYYKRYQQLTDSLNAMTEETDARRKIGQFEFERREDSLKYVQRLATQRINEQMKLQKAEIKSKKYQSYFYMGGLAALVVLSGFIGLNYYNQRKANAIINEANAELSNKQEEITAQRDQLADAITELRAAQTQLIQSEKMASLGELTAGIAHEIQNPLNFVNNFSEVSTEMLTELNDELNKGDITEARALADELQKTLEKINHHGKRADSIVKGMLEHSRASSGQKEPTNINKLTDEYLRLAYHGLRAKDKSFNAELITHFTDDLPAAQVIPQEMGRVLLNLFNNAFYAVHQKQKSIGANYKPTVEVSTALNNNHLQITVKDNGTGIPNDIKDKIMQPFFTTKPTGQGTGLGLSLSYDVVVKVHGGKINVESVPGEQTTFTVSLPV